MSVLNRIRVRKHVSLAGLLLLFSQGILAAAGPSAMPSTPPAAGEHATPWKYDVIVIQSQEYRGGVSQAFDHIYCDENGQIWLKVSVHWPDPDLKSTDQYSPRSRGYTLVSKDYGLTWAFTEQPYPGPRANRSVLPGGVMIETGLNGYIRHPRSEIDRLKKEGYLVKDLGESQGYCAILYDMWMRRSRDGGKTWEAKPIHEQFGFFAYLVAFPVQGVLSDGTVVSFAYGKRKVEGPRNAYIVRSEDAGDTWDLIQMADGQLAPVANGFSEIFPVIFADGRIMALLRTQLASGAYVVHSTDGGKTWSKPAETPIRAKHPVPKLLRDGTIVVTYQRRFAQPYGFRARFTPDLGKTWSDEVVLRDDFAIEDGLGWTHTVELPDGTLFTTMGGNKYLKGETRQHFQHGVRWTRDYRRPFAPPLSAPPRAPVFNVEKTGKSPWGE